MNGLCKLNNEGNNRHTHLSIKNIEHGSLLIMKDAKQTNELANRYQSLVNKGTPNFDYPKIVRMYEDSVGAIGSLENNNKSQNFNKCCMI
jgi:hypothetical protein